MRVQIELDKDLRDRLLRYKVDKEIKENKKLSYNTIVKAALDKYLKELGY